MSDAMARALEAIAHEIQIANLLTYAIHADDIADGHKEWIEKSWGFTKDEV